MTARLTVVAAVRPADYGWPTNNLPPTLTPAALADGGKVDATLHPKREASRNDRSTFVLRFRQYSPDDDGVFTRCRDEYRDRCDPGIYRIRSGESSSSVMAQADTDRFDRWRDDIESGDRRLSRRNEARGDRCTQDIERFRHTLDALAERNQSSDHPPRYRIGRHFRRDCAFYEVAKTTIVGLQLSPE
jgi:hypothetical protein